jgi:O-antigen chain-terminating methyltransferase
LNALKNIIARTPIIGSLARKLWHTLRHIREVWRSPYRLQNEVHANADYLARVISRLESSEARLESSEARLESSEARLESSEARLESSEARLESSEARLENADIRLSSIETTRTSNYDIQKLRREILILQQRIDQRTQAAALDIAPDSMSPKCSAISPSLPEGFYLAFENRFRGEYASIQARQSVYLPMVQHACSATANRPLLDIGSGRGEWLQLLAQHKVDAYGVDADSSMVAACLDLGLDARLGNALEHLAALHEGELGMITGFHIAEHLPFAELVRLFEAAYRALQPGGVLILETPNPENLLVGACYFYTDPTHQRPLPPDLLAFVAENRGFAQVEIMRLHPFPQYLAAQSREGGASEMERFMYNAPDYAVIARKPMTTPSDASH